MVHEINIKLNKHDLCVMVTSGFRVRACDGKYGIFPKFVCTA